MTPCKQELLLGDVSKCKSSIGWKLSFAIYQMQIPLKTAFTGHYINIKMSNPLIQPIIDVVSISIAR